MPLHIVQTDFDAGTLVQIRVADVPRSLTMPMKTVYRKTRPGPAARAFIAELRPRSTASS